MDVLRPEMQQSPRPSGLGLCAGGRYWDRTSDLFRVREARYRCANRPFSDLAAGPSSALVPREETSRLGLDDELEALLFNGGADPTGR